MILVLSAVLPITLLAANGNLNSTAMSNENDNVIIVTETGVARKQETSQTIYCGDVKWHIAWKSDSRGAITEAEIVYFSGINATVLKDAAIDLISKAENLDAVSASCNPNSEGKPAVSKLRVLATAKHTGAYIAGELVIDNPILKSNWAFTSRQ